MTDKCWLLVSLALCTMLAMNLANASDTLLEIYGNADMDDMIDEDDITYVEGVIKGTNERTRFSDANYDGQVNEKDITQIKKIINGEEGNITIVDSADRIVTLIKPVDRIVCFHYGAVEAIQTLGAADKIIGVNRQTVDKTDFYKIDNVSNIGYVDDPDYEEILNRDADLVILFASIHTWDAECAKIKKTLEEADPDITVLSLDFVTIDGYLNELNKLSYIIDREDKAQEFAEFYNRWLDEIRDRVKSIPDENRTKVYFEMATWPKGYSTCSEGSFGLHECIITAGGINIFGDRNESFFDVDPEAVMMRNPDVMLNYGFGNYAETGKGLGGNPEKMKEIRDEMLNRSELKDVNAVKDGRVYIIPWDVTCGGGKHLIGISYMAKWFYPELFSDISVEDIESIHQEYLTRFMGLDYDLSDLGTFVYPSI